MDFESEIEQCLNKLRFAVFNNDLLNSSLRYFQINLEEYGAQTFPISYRVDYFQIGTWTDFYPKQLPDSVTA